MQLTLKAVLSNLVSSSPLKVYHALSNYVSNDSKARNTARVNFFFLKLLSLHKSTKLLPSATVNEVER